MEVALHMFAYLTQSVFLQVEEYWQRSQWGPGIVADFNSEENALDFVTSIGYSPTVKSLVGAAV